MMDWYFGHDHVGDTFGSKDQVYFDRLPSPDSWSNWGVCGYGTGNPIWPNCYDDGGTIVSDQKLHQPETDPSSEESLSWNHLGQGCPDLQLSELTVADQMDDIFLSSLLQDNAPAAVHNRIQVGVPPQSQPKCSEIPVNSDSTQTTLDFHRMCSDTDGVGSSTVSNLSQENSLDQSHDQALEALATMNMHRSDQEAGGEDSSMEESVLQGLESVLNQLSSKTRLCFRDALYRLAQRSQLPTSAEVSEEGPPLDRMTTTAPTGESETNTIDRTVANLMFQNPYSN